jgi:hypothetical protein
MNPVYQTYPYCAGELRQGHAVFVRGKRVTRLEDLPSDLPGTPAAVEASAPSPEPASEKPSRRKPKAE